MLTDKKYENYDFDWLYANTGDPSDRRADGAFMLAEMARQALLDGKLIDKTIERIGVHMTLGRPFPPLVGQLAFEKLLEEGGSRILQCIVKHMNAWDADRQMTAFDLLPSPTFSEGDQTQQKQLKLIHFQETFDFQPKFIISDSVTFPGSPEFHCA